ncbi:uncharacterized protein LOC121991335 [Zingiber officinale]|uniref:uncharacterized protein LOC121991335 n=1 Tax=Zingiber officinale TaxID=94328 RepID=UPI001C4BE3F7|nr:uncharacterized protein LOC121991335 [Zingiber officinale]
MTTGGSHPDAKWALEFEAKHETRMDKLEKTMASLVTIVQELKDRLEVDSSSSILIKRGKNQQSRQQQYDQGANSNEDREHNYPRMKVEFPRWENNDPIGWISRAEKYFRFHSTSDNAKVELASINLEGDAIQWYDWLEACHGPPKWEEFKEELINRFGPSGYENVDGELAKIQQTSTVLEYQGRFERLSNRTRDWSEKQLLGTFIEGLRLDIRQEVKMNQPRTMKAALSFARLQEEKINEEGRRNNKVILENPSHYSTPRRLTKEEIKERMAKGLCWHCDEKWHRGHQCKQKRILMIEPIENSEEEDDFDEGETQDNINEVQYDSMAISVHALEGLQTPQTMKVKGFIKKQPVMILIDSGSTNNFLDSTLASRLKQKIEQASTFDVKVADGRSLTSPGNCNSIKILLPNYELITDLFLPPLDGCDVVLGAQWLKTLGDIIWNFSQLTMRFQDQGKEVCIRGKKQDTITPISSYQAEQLLKKDCYIFLMQLSIKKDPKANVRSYRYPYIQEEIEKIVQVMLQVGIVRPSIIPYSSLVLLVQKKDKKWRICIDYPTLNKIIMKDKYPILIIDELLDELGGSSLFSKLNLRSGFHQIRIHQPNIPKTTFQTHDGHYEFLVMPFGLINAPSTFQSLLNDIFRFYLRQFVLNFFDDNLVYSSSFEDHLHHLYKVLTLLCEHSLYVKRVKCSFWTTNVEYLGHIVSQNRVATDPSKVLVSKSIKALRDVLDLTDAFRWCLEAKKIFQNLKEAMMTTLVLALPNKQFVIEPDAFEVRIGAILMNYMIPFKKMFQRRWNDKIL